MWLGTRHLLLRCTLVWLAATSCAVLAAAAASPRLVELVPHPPATLDRALTDLATAALAACAGWMWVTTTSAVAEALRGRGPRGRAGLVRRGVLLACGVAAVAGPCPSATADHQNPAVTTLPYPDRAVAPHHRDARPRPQAVVVRPGDTLWAIAGRDLGPAATDAEVAARWPAVYARNRRTIGPDPDLLEPGQRLLLPGEDP